LFWICFGRWPANLHGPPNPTFLARWAAGTVRSSVANLRVIHSPDATRAGIEAAIPWSQLNRRFIFILFYRQRSFPQAGTYVNHATTTCGWWTPGS
jgi:hypothetical protein